MNDKQNLTFWDLSELTMSGLLFIILYTSVALLFNIHITLLNLIVPILLALFVWYIRKQALGIKTILKVWVIFFVVVIVMGFYSGMCIDHAWDSDSYHKLAIGQMKDGWNPVYESGYQYYVSNINEADISKYIAAWVTYYPKASWFLAASVYKLTGNIESGKVISFLVLFLTTGVCYDYIYDRFLSKRFAVFFAFFLSATPVSIVQLSSYYVDGMLANLFTVIVVLLLGISDQKYKRKKKDLFLMLAAAIIFCSNLKFTGLVYSGLFCFAFYVYWLILSLKKGKKEFWENIKRLTVFYITVVVLTVGVVGASSYVRNLVVEGNPFFPLFGKNKIDIVSGFQPDSSQNSNKFINFLKMLFSKVENPNKDAIQYKFPFTFEWSEIVNIAHILDIRRSGFGIFFSGLAIISCVVYIFMLYRLYKNNRESFYPLAIIAGISIFIVGVMDASWWARYVPFVYLMVVIAVLWSVLFAQKYKKKKSRMFAKVFTLITLLNLMPFFGRPVVFVNVISYQTSKQLSCLSGQNIYIYDQYKEFWGSLYNLKDADIGYKIVDDKDKYQCNKYIQGVRWYYSSQ